MAKGIVLEKLESLRRCLARIRERCPADAATLKSDPDAQDILSLNLSRAVQICVDIATHLLAGSEQPPPDTMGQSFDRLVGAGHIDAALATRMKSAVGFRNIAVHSYREIDWEIVFSIVSHDLSDFEDFARAVLRQP